MLHTHIHTHTYPPSWRPSSQQHELRFQRRPLQLLPRQDERLRLQPWAAVLERPGSPWREAAEMRHGPSSERHYQEFVTFLPHVQRFLYGDGPRAGSARTGGGSSMRVLRRDDVQARLGRVRESVVHAGATSGAINVGDVA